MKNYLNGFNQTLSRTKKLFLALFITTIGGGLHAQSCKLDDYTLAACNNNTVTFSLSNYTGNLTAVSPRSTSGLTYSTYSFNTTAGTISFQDFNFTNYKGFGTITFEVTLGGSTCTFTVKVGECCSNNPAPPNVFIEETVPAAVYTGITWMYGDCILVNNTEFNNGEVLSAPDARLIVARNSSVSGLNTTFSKMCDFAWDGFFIDDVSCKLDLVDSYLSEAIRGVYSHNNGELTATNTNFFNNIISLLVEEHNTWGPYWRSHIKLDGNKFDFSGLLNSFNVHPSSPIVPSDFFQGDCSTVGSGYSIPILIRENSIEVGIGHRSLSPNIFDDPNFYAADITWLEVHGSQVRIRNNTFKDGNYSICSDDNSQVSIGGANPLNGNTFESKIASFKTAQHIENNTFSDEADLTITNPAHLLPVAGSPALGSYIHDNTFTDVRFDLQGDNALTQVRILDNTFTDSYVRLYDLDQNANGRVIFNDNTISGVPLYNSLTIYNCDAIVVGQNAITRGGSATKNGMAFPIGIDIHSTQDGVIMKNSITNFERGIEMDGNATGTQFTCNQLIDCYYGFYLDNPTMSHQSNTATNDNNMNEWTLCINTIGGAPNNAINWYHPTSPSSFNPGFSISGLITPLVGSTVVCGNITPPIFKHAGNSTNTNGIETELIEGNELKEDGSITGFDIYPNPASSTLNVEFNKALIDNELRIYNSTGNLVLVETLQDEKMSIDISSLPNGVYLVHIGKYNTRFVKI